VTESLPKERTLPDSITKEYTIPPADLNLNVQWNPSGNEPSLQFSLFSSRGKVRYNNKKFGKVPLSEEPKEKVKEIYDELSKMAREELSSDEQADAKLRLSSIGNDLWETIIPKELKDEYWHFSPQVKSLLITSDEPWIPWEIIKPYDDNHDDESFWCQKFAVSRWLSESGNIEILTAGTALPVAAANVDLEHSREEIEFLGKLNDLHSGIQCQTPLNNYQDVLKWLKNENFSIMHFACHGELNERYSENSPIFLSGRPLKPSDINIKFDERRLRPLIFINACHTGRSGFSLTWLGGWPNRFVNVAHVGAFIGAMWEVDDQLAVLFAKSFYTALLKDKMPIAEAFRHAREEIRLAKPYNSSWLAYVLYADPNAMMLDL
jgi:hypothetical protein